MSVCSATAAATRPGRRESRSSSSRASTTEAQFFMQRSGSKQLDPRYISVLILVNRVKTHKNILNIYISFNLIT